jgi:hypothetical protein
LLHVSSNGLFPWVSSLGSTRYVKLPLCSVSSRLNSITIGSDFALHTPINTHCRIPLHPSTPPTYPLDSSTHLTQLLHTHSITHQFTNSPTCTPTHPPTCTRLSNRLFVAAQVPGVVGCVELDWWSAAKCGATTTMTCTPAQHFSGRTLWDRDATLWARCVFCIFHFFQFGLFTHFCLPSENLLRTRCASSAPLVACRDVTQSSLAPMRCRPAQLSR